ncbi:GGDEF and EAL domain-containing protein [Bacillus sp. S/N-304-OC-R1]|uniref:sensor domain-containing protein n=1 Tax=Bacillus sp. S/N-304-OC-R1 TaxID=2758034 RepID=UPI001C8D5FE3|nr:GGDEF and EAL domain-containing protein [Bacillus sp. S/N-304-OC-R1]MBY0122642.1 EAL domain-containing protein [Bacillus sp. S/N-304-OC-R1]
MTLSEIVIRSIDEGVIILNKDFNILSLNPKANASTGLQEDEAIGGSLLSFFHEVEIFQAIFSYLEMKSKWEGEARLVRKNGDIFPASLTVQLLNEGDDVKYLVIFKDLTFERMSKNKMELAEKVLENTSEGVMVTDQNARILSVNPAFEIVTGFNVEEVIGKNPNILQSGIHDSQFYKNMWKEIYEKGQWKGEIWNKRKNGDVFLEWITISCIKDEQGFITNFVAVFSDITDRKHAEDQLRYLAHYDSLTGVANRYSLNKRLEGLIYTAKKYNQILAVLFLDLDRFKQINDTLGHNYGDLLLKNVSARLKGLLKNKDMIARLGGDEFVIVLPNLKHPKEAVRIAETIIDALTRPFLLDKQEVYISTSIGISLFPLDGTDIETLLRNADKAMYEAKNAGRNQFELYHTQMHHNESRQMMLENYLRKAIDRNELFLVYHPIIDSQTNKVVSVEALVRWKQEKLGLIPPSEFIPLAEESGLIMPISEWIIQKACEDLKTLHLHGHNKIRMGINISAIHFNQVNFVKSISEILQTTNVNSTYLDFELTESMIMPKADETVDRLVKLKQLGLKLSIDDFGTGYSSLSYLNRFPLDTLKIDQSFINGISSYKEDCSIVQAIITMAHRLHLKVVAEGVENKKQFEFLKNENCDFIQGYYISKPIPLHKLLTFFDNWNTEILK